MQHAPAIIGVVIVVVLGLTPLIEHKRETDRAYQAAQKEYAESKRVSPPGRAGADGKDTEHKSYRDEWRAEQDLKAQQEMADTSWLVAIATWVGVVFLAATLFETAKAAKAAADAAKAAGMNVDVLVGAERAQVLEIIEKQNVDYVVAGALDTGLPQDDAHTFSVDVSVAFKNYGKTFGILRRVSYQLECRADLPTEPVYRERALRPVQTLEPRDESDTYYCAIDGNVITLRQARLISEGRLTVWFYGRVFYSHIFGGPDVEHRFIYHYRGGGFERIYRKNYSSHYNADA